jgi:tripartite ATP-independent transporter DctP family solute receptor
MNIRRRSLFFCLAGILILSTNLFAAEYTIRVANDVAKEHSWGKACEKFKKNLEEVSNGRIKVEVHHSGSLGKVREAMEMAKMGTLEVALSGVGHIQRHVPELGVLVLPFLWKDMETMFQVLDGPLGGYIESRLAVSGFHALGFWDNGFRHITNNRRPIKSVADLKGLKIRTLPTPVHIAYFKALGAAPTPMGWVELFEALRTGVVDAQENPPGQVYTARFFEVQKYYSLTGHVNEPGLVVMSKKIYDDYPDDLKLAVDVAARKATLWQRAENDKDNKTFLKELEEKGMKINTPSESDIAQFRKIALQGYPEAAKGFGKMGKELSDLFVWANK